MARKYRLFIQHKELRLVKQGSKGAEGAHLSVKERMPAWPSLLNQLKKHPSSIFIIACKNVDETWRGFKKRFRIIRAGGGIVVNEHREVLMIHRLGHWDLPKGKLEKGEAIVDCAIREVEEECGIERLGVRGKLGLTYHIMKRGNHRFLKETHWYFMNTFYDGKLSPQEEEGIEAVEWVPSDAVKSYLDKSWPSVVAVFQLLRKDKRFQGKDQLMR